MADSLLFAARIAATGYALRAIGTSYKIHLNTDFSSFSRRCHSACERTAHGRGGALGPS